MSYFITFLVELSLPYNRVTYFLNGPLVFCKMILFDFHTLEVPTLRKDIFVGIDFRKFIFRILCENRFPLFGIYEGFRGIDLNRHNL